MIRFSNLVENYIHFDYYQNNEQYLSQNPYAFHIINENSIQEEENKPDIKNNSNNIIDNSPAPNIIEKSTKVISNFNKNNEGLWNNNRKITIDLDLLNENDFSQGKIKKSEKDRNEEKKKPGRKRLRNEEYNNKNNFESKIEHNKFSDDNIRRKVKHLVIKYLQEFLNNQIKNIYQGEIGNGIFIKELKTINQTQISDATIKFNKKFLTKKLCEIFSENITTRFTNLPPNHNKVLIKKLMNEEDENKKNYFKKIFNLEFINCLRHFRGEIHIEELDGLKCFNDIKNEILDKYSEDGSNYYEVLKNYLIRYEEIIGNKKSRRARKKKNENTN